MLSFYYYNFSEAYVNYTLYVNLEIKAILKICYVHFCMEVTGTLWLTMVIGNRVFTAKQCSCKMVLCDPIE